MHAPDVSLTLPYFALLPSYAWVFCCPRIRTVELLSELALRIFFETEPLRSKEETHPRRQCQRPPNQKALKPGRMSLRSRSSLEIL
ncbi:hypothetical protein CC78DRAFT_354611 [Lojkania enalia]|uniref:Uncharacterized protein n=1 Tax=Lojkania enalia TaxID=147567 RepID=A0A9P4KHI7_9PLEO|nr:hypothetical protein CC78DRAFT_354611 [Didymosphaeria enalia]